MDKHGQSIQYALVAIVVVLVVVVPLECVLHMYVVKINHYGHNNNNKQQQQRAATTTDTAKCLLWSKATSSRCAFVMQLSCLSPVPPFPTPLAVIPPPPLDTVTVSGHHTANVIFETFQCV